MDIKKILSAPEGKEHGVYIRLGSSTRQAGTEFIEEMKRQHTNKSFDQLPCPPHGMEILDIQFIQEVFKGTGRKIHEQQLVSLGILTPFAGKNVVTHGGLICFGKPEIRQTILPDARVSCARFRDTNKTHFIDQLDLEGSIIEVIDQVSAFIRRNTRLYPKIAGMKRKDIPAYPVFAIREILVNSVAHCDYSLTGMHVMVAIFSDRLEIQNPGLLPFGMTINHLKAGVSRIRNRVVARVFKELGLMEEWGSGYKRVVDFCEENGYPIPEWQEIGPAFRVTIYPHPEAEEVTPPVTPPVEKLLSVCKKAIGRHDLQEELGIKDKKHFRESYLKHALEQKFLEMTIPDKPNSPLQKYRLSKLGRQWIEKNHN
jgi:predicted HTH transcriptional regulator